ncbi:MAG TPA: hypothetical protein VFS08_11410 [Gemmatimonadaceae bacterium]|nr:hypothetical protein [Gemmatimonadaceae bacterium]
MTAAHHPEPAGSRAVPPTPVAPAPATPHARALVAALATGEPLRAPVDTAVRAFVRTERNAGRELDDVLTSLRTLLREHVEPPLPTETRAALREAAAWFAVSEYYRAD